MKKIVTILFLSSYLFATTELSQLFKLPVLISHFMEHKQEDKDLSFWQFLCIHYAHGNPKDADYDKDMKLPFKAHDNCVTSIICITTPPSLQFSVKHSYSVEIKQQFHTQNFQFSSYYLSSIWQPPKTA